MDDDFTPEDIYNLACIINDKFYINVTNNRYAKIIAWFRFDRINKKIKVLKDTFVGINNTNLKYIRGVKSSYIEFNVISDGEFIVNFLLYDNLKTDKLIIQPNDISNFILRRKRLNSINKLMNSEEKED